MSEEVPDARRRLGLEGRAPATTAAPTNPHVCRNCGHDCQQHAPQHALKGPRCCVLNCMCRKFQPPEHVAELERLADENRVLKGFATDHGHDRCEAQAQALRDKVADLEVHTAEQHAALVAIAAHFADEVAFPGSPLGKVRDAFTVQPPQHRRQLLGYQTSDGRLYQPEDITLVYTLDQGETARDGDR